MDQSLLDAVKAGDFTTVDYLLRYRADVNLSDEKGWIPLSFAAGKGDLAMVKLLLERGADPLKVGEDNRTPYLIALAAGQVEVANYLHRIENSTDPEKAHSLRPEVSFCKAFRLKDLRKFSDWSENRNRRNESPPASLTPSGNGELADEQIVFLQADFTVTQSPRPDEKVIFDQVNQQWREFSLHTLGFKPPTALID